MLTAEGKLTACFSTPDKKNQGQSIFYCKILSKDGQELIQVKVKPDSFAKLAQQLECDVMLSVKVNVFNNNIYYQEV